MPVLGIAANGHFVYLRIKAPTEIELTLLTHSQAHRTGRQFKRHSLRERGAENSFRVSDDLETAPMAQRQRASIARRVAVGPRQGRKVLTLKALPARGEAF